MIYFSNGGIDMKNAFFLREEQLEMVTGGQVNDNMTPDGPNIDEIFNGKNYDRIADNFVEWLYRNDQTSSYTKRSRQVNNNVDPYNFD